MFILTCSSSPCGVIACSPITVNLKVHSSVASISFSQFSSVTQLCPTLCDPIDGSMPGFPVLHHLPEFALTHVYQVSDAIQLSHPLLSPFPPAFNLSQHQGLFQWASLWQKGTEHWKRNFPKKKSIKYLGYRSKGRVKFPKQSTQAGQDKPGLLIQFIFKITQKATGLALETREGLVVQSPGHAWLFATPWTIAHQAPLSSFSNVS